MRLLFIATTALLLNRPQNPHAASLYIDTPQCNSVQYPAPVTLSYSSTLSRPWRKLVDSLIRRIWSSSVQESSLDDSLAVASISSRYGGEVVLRFSVGTEEEARSLHEAINILFLDVWQINEKWIDIRIAKDVVPSLLGLLPKSLQRAHKPLMGELELLQAIADTYPKDVQSSQSPLFVPNTPTLSIEHECVPPDNTNVFFQDYQPLSVIQPWMELMQALFPTHVRIISVGTSYEGRNISALKLGTHPTYNDEPAEPRQTILVTGGLHAREWISVSAVNYIAYSLITSYGRDKTMTKLIDSFDWIFVPTLNPDGYVYSWEIDRLWRKNRQPTSLRFCRGIDLDRSWGFHWNDDDYHDSNIDHDSKNTEENHQFPSQPTDDNPCSESYAGDKPFAAIETSSFATWAHNLTESDKSRIVGLLDLHSYSQEVLYPYSYSCKAVPPSLENLQELGLGISRAIHRTYGRAYGVAPACTANSFNLKDNNTDTSLLGSGGSQLDWMYHELGVRHAFQIKLPDTGSYGFLLPKKEIVPTGKEMLSAVLDYGRFLLDEDESQSLLQTETEPEPEPEPEPETQSGTRENGDEGEIDEADIPPADYHDDDDDDDDDDDNYNNNDYYYNMKEVKDWVELRKH